MALFPPLVADVLLILTGVISIVALVSAAYGWSIIINGRKEVDKIDKFREANIDKMEKLAKALIDFVNKSREETT